MMVWDDDDHGPGPDGSWRDMLDAVVGWTVPITVIGLAGWKLVDLGRAAVRALVG